jgi:uncharacterized protein YegP (UPF0339 family)
MKTIFSLYQDKKKEWRWRAERAGRIVADSGEGYKRRATCRRSMIRFIKSLVAEQYDYRDVWPV